MEFKQLSLTQAAKYDHDNGLKTRLTGWGKICHERAGLETTRKARVRRNLSKKESGS
jgi:hypothetical protein